MEQQTIQPFLTVANYHLLEQQLNKILHALTTTKDKNVILAVRGLVDTEVTTKLALTAAETKLIDQLLLSQIVHKVMHFRAIKTICHPVRR